LAGERVRPRGRSRTLVPRLLLGAMAVLVVAGTMGIVWVAAIAGVVAMEKLSSRGEALARWAGVVLIVAAAWKGVSGAGGCVGTC